MTLFKKYRLIRLKKKEAKLKKQYAELKDFWCGTPSRSIESELGDIYLRIKELENA